MPSHESSTVLVLSGLDGGNPLAFLAAIGTLRTATRAAPSAEWTLNWKMHDGHWSPVLGGSMPLKEDSLIELLMPILKSMDGDPALCFADDLTVSRERFRGVAQDAHRAATLTNRHFADFVVAFGCDSLSVFTKGPDSGHCATHHERGRTSALPQVHAGPRADHGIDPPEGFSVCAVAVFGPSPQPSLGSSGRSPACVALEEPFGGFRADDAWRQPACHRGAASPTHGTRRTPASYDRVRESSW